MKTINQYINRKKNKKVFSEHWGNLMNSVIMPVVHRVTARTLANDLVTVQPIRVPTTNLFHFDFQYDTTSESTFPFWKIKVIFKEKE